MSDLSETFKRLERDPQGGSQYVMGLLERTFSPFVQRLDTLLDKRLVRTLLECLVAIIRLRCNPQALWLSELGAYLHSADGVSTSAAAGTKRVGKLLRSVKWTAEVIDQYLLEQADQRVRQLQAQGQRILCLWDGSVLEKAESATLEGLCPVLSSKAKRRQRSRHGLVFNWPAPRPVRVMGMQWTAGLIVGMHGLPQVAISRWWSTRGVFASKQRDTEEEALRQCVRKWGSLLVHVFDRGYASGPWLLVLRAFRARFVIRWITNHEFVTVEGVEKKLWQVGHGKRYLAHQLIRDPHSGEKMPCDLWWTALRHPSTPDRLFLVKARVKQGVMYLITNEVVQTEAQAWDVFFTYRRRWQIETCFRYAKCELALECPRLWSLEARLKLLGIVMLVYVFLLSLLEPEYHDLVEALLRFKCHRTGKRCRQARVPLYRLRWALSRLWNEERPLLTCFLPPPPNPAAAAMFLWKLQRLQQNWG